MDYRLRYYYANHERLKAQHRDWAKANAERLREYGKSYRARNPEAVKMWRWRSKLRDRYGLTPVDYERMALKQSGVCAICAGSQHPRIGRLDIDHDHATGRVRALLCRRCNLAVAHAERKGSLTPEIEAYLTAH